MSHPLDGLTRRDALSAGLVGVAGAAGLAALASGAQPALSPGGAKPWVEPLSPKEMGWDEATKSFVLPDLGYAENALEPHIDAQTMNIHRTQHHAAYVRGLNTALAKLAEIRDGSGDASLIKHWSRELAFHGSGHANHCLFWTIMAPAGKGGGGGGGQPAAGSPLAKAMDESFGSFDKFALHFKTAAMAVEGGGWAWLVYHPVTQRLYVMQGESQQQMNWSGAGVHPLLGLDVWEHAYYLKYQSKRKDYVEAFFSVINWGRVNLNLVRAQG